MTLDPQVQVLLEQIAAAGRPPRFAIPLEEARALSIANAAALNGQPEAVKHVEDKMIPGPGSDIPVRVYTPEGTGPFPALVFFHGGGWVLSNLDTHDGICRQLANKGGCVVVNVDYRLAPEHKFPAAPEDCFAATEWVANNASSLNVDPKRIAVGGDSAGGNLATVVALMAHEHGGPALVYQLLIYPVTDYHTPGTRSYVEKSEGYNLSRDDMVWFWGQYLSDEAEAYHPYASPLRAESLRGLPPAFIITAEHDPLRDEGEAYAARLQAEGVTTVLKRFPGVIHGFFNMSGVIDLGKQAIADAGAALREAFAHI